jgi:hypothetical protein
MCRICAMTVLCSSAVYGLMTYFLVNCAYSKKYLTYLPIYSVQVQVSLWSVQYISGIVFSSAAIISALTLSLLLFYTIISHRYQYKLLPSLSDYFTPNTVIIRSAVSGTVLFHSLRQVRLFRLGTPSTPHRQTPHTLQLRAICMLYKPLLSLSPAPFFFVWLST